MCLTEYTRGSALCGTHHIVSYYTSKGSTEKYASITQRPTYSVPCILQPKLRGEKRGRICNQTVVRIVPFESRKRLPYVERKHRPFYQSFCTILRIASPKYQSFIETTGARCFFYRTTVPSLRFSWRFIALSNPPSCRLSPSSTR